MLKVCPTLKNTIERSLWTVAAELVTAEKEAARIQDELAPHHPEPE